MALGTTQQLPLKDKYNYSKEYIEDEIAVALGGRVSEDIFIGSVTTGAGNDFEKATEMAWNMVTSWGMSEKLGPLAYKTERNSMASIWDPQTGGQYSEDTAREIDKEVQSIVMKAKETAERILNNHKTTIHKVIDALYEKEVLGKEEFEALIKGQPIPTPRSVEAEATEEKEAAPGENETGVNPEPSKNAPPLGQPVSSS